MPRPVLTLAAAWAEFDVMMCTEAGKRPADATVVVASQTPAEDRHQDDRDARLSFLRSALGT
jgi:hypothetical protein